MTSILGISALYHDSAAALVVDGRIVAAAQQERFSRVKNDRRFPVAAIEYCLQEAGLDPGKIDYVAYYEKPLLKFDRVLETFTAVAPLGFRPFSNAIPSWLKEKLYVTRELKRILPGFKRRVLFAEHHDSHAASAFFPSPFDEAAILTIDGVGEWATATTGVGRGNQIQLTSELRFPHSLGLLYSAFTYYCGFEVDSGEYKLMGLAPYGEPVYVDRITGHVVDVKPDGSLWLDMSYFDYCHGLRMTSDKLHELFGGPPRAAGEPLEQRHLDIAASIQKLTEEIILRMIRHVHEQTGLRKLCLAGGVALNAVANGRIVREGPFDEVWIQPAAGDAGGALGAALLVWHQLLENPRVDRTADTQRGSLLGPQFDSEQVRSELNRSGAVFQEVGDEAALRAEVTNLLADQKVVGWFQGRMEFGPRALGNRSILADPRDAQMQRVLNQKIKFRESFRPFAPAILTEHTPEWFEVTAEQRSPYMLMVTGVHSSKRCNVDAADEPSGLTRLSVVRSEIPAVTHVDYSARLQTVDADSNPAFAALLHEFRRQTGCPLLVNTSFNVKDEPIVCSPRDAYECFMATDMDVLVMGNFLLRKEEQPGSKDSKSGRQLNADHLATPALMAGAKFVDLDEVATPRQLRVFGIGLVAATAVLAVVAFRSSAWTALWSTLAGVLAVSAAIHWMFPAARQTIYRGYMYAAFPMNWVVSNVVLAVIFYGILTPIAFCRRLLMQRDDLRLRPNRSAATYWQARSRPVDRDRYLRQF